MADQYVKQLDIGEGENAQTYPIKDAEARDLIEALQAENESLKEQITELNSELEVKTVAVGEATLYVYGKLCILSFVACAFTPDELVIPEEYRPPMLTWNIATLGRYSDVSTGFYRMGVQTDGLVVFQDSTGTNISSALSSVRGEISWIIN